MLKADTHAGIAAGDITLAFRCWKRPTVRTGGALKTAIGVLAIEAVDPISLSTITSAEARAAGYDSRAALVRALETRDGTPYRIRLRLAGEDPRIALRQQPLTPAQHTELQARLQRMDRASRSGPWTRAYLELIQSRPATRAPDLAASVGLETKPFKQRIRRLKELGLTESLKVGYRLSPRGESYLRGP
ncbi:MAG: hypothetical protein OXT09_29730 [Myxococcales bacterium]|nr:hypothetical protein [Myxococcales bacterium]